MHLENLQSALARRRLHGDLTIEPTGADERLVQHVDAVRGGDAHHPGVAPEPVELHQELVQRLVAFVVARPARASRSADGVELVDEDDRGRLLLRLREEVADARGADAHEHLDKLGRGEGEERGAGLAGDGPGEERLAAAGGTGEHHALGNLGARRLELLRLAKEVHDLRELDLRVADAGDVGELDNLRLVAHLHLGPKLALLHPTLRFFNLLLRLLVNLGEIHRPVHRRLLRHPRRLLLALLLVLLLGAPRSLHGLLHGVPVAPRVALPDDLHRPELHKLIRRIRLVPAAGAPAARPAALLGDEEPGSRLQLRPANVELLLRLIPSLRVLLLVDGVELGLQELEGGVRLNLLHRLLAPLNLQHLLPVVEVALEPVHGPHDEPHDPDADQGHAVVGEEPRGVGRSAQVDARARGVVFGFIRNLLNLNPGA